MKSYVQTGPLARRNRSAAVKQIRPLHPVSGQYRSAQQIIVGSAEGGQHIEASLVGMHLWRPKIAFGKKVLPRTESGERSLPLLQIPAGIYVEARSISPDILIGTSK
ncbi:hypothetical protein D3C81_1600030 [compost metagenome]